MAGMYTDPVIVIVILRLYEGLITQGSVIVIIVLTIHIFEARRACYCDDHINYLSVWNAQVPVTIIAIFYRLSYFSLFYPEPPHTHTHTPRLAWTVLDGSVSSDI